MPGPEPPARRGSAFAGTPQVARGSHASANLRSVLVRPQALLRPALLLLALFTALAARSPAEAASRRDLQRDEKRGGHTLSRHVGLSDAQLRERLSREKGISAASTYTDRATAEEAVFAALKASRQRVERWAARDGARTNLVVEWPGTGRVLGRSLRRGAKEPVPCTRALVVLRWDEQSELYYVLTSYPEASR